MLTYRRSPREFILDQDNGQIDKLVSDVIIY